MYEEEIASPPKTLNVNDSFKNIAPKKMCLVFVYALIITSIFAQALNYSLVYFSFKIQYVHSSLVAFPLNDCSEIKTEKYVTDCKKSNAEKTKTLKSREYKKLISSKIFVNHGVLPSVSSMKLHSDALLALYDAYPSISEPDGAKLTDKIIVNYLDKKYHPTDLLVSLFWSAVITSIFGLLLYLNLMIKCKRQDKP